MTAMGETWTGIGSVLASLMFGYAMFQQYFPSNLQAYIEIYTDRFLSYFNPYIQISIPEYRGQLLKKSDTFSAIQTYLGSRSTTKAKRLKADVGKGAKNVVLTMDDYEEVVDEFEGVKLWWYSSRKITQTQTISFYPGADEKRYLLLKFHRRNREMVTNTYLSYVVEQGKAIAMKNRHKKLYTNNPSQNWYDYQKKSMWSHVVFDHPAKFDTMAMDPVKKKEIMDDLDTFKAGKDYYKKIGKAWKRGYLLYGPPGTGKSTMIAAMANYLDYDIYDLELTAVKENSELRKLLIETSNKSIIVIEDIDCSLDLTGRRKVENKEKDEDGKDPIQKQVEERTSGSEESNGGSKVTLSGLLNSIDGLWSACGKERIIIFTTNYIDKLDSALIRRGRMDQHIELSYCGFEGFKVLAKNYLNLDSHHLFEIIQGLMEKSQMTPADVAENLMPKTVAMDAESCLKKLIKALENAKEEAKLKDAKKNQEPEPEPEPEPEANKRKSTLSVFSFARRILRKGTKKKEKV